MVEPSENVTDTDGATVDCTTPDKVRELNAMVASVTEIADDDTEMDRESRRTPSVTVTTLRPELPPLAADTTEPARDTDDPDVTEYVRAEDDATQSVNTPGAREPRT
jgi:hypothetical protein